MVKGDIAENVKLLPELKSKCKMLEFNTIHYTKDKVLIDEMLAIKLLS